MRHTILFVAFLLLSSVTWAENFFELLTEGVEWDVLKEAAENLTPESVQAALDAGDEMNARDEDGQTALMYAAQYNENPEVLQVLLDVGANAFVKDDSGNTAWDYARWNEALKGTDVYWELGGYFAG